MSGAVDCINGIGSFLVGSCKIALFLLILAFLLAEILWMISLSKISNNLNAAVPGFIGLRHYIFAAGSAVAAAVGCYAVLKSHQTYLRVCACLCGIIALLLVITSVMSASYEDDNNKFVTHMTSAFQDYNWFQEDPAATRNEDTVAWDTIQSGLGCCGITNSSDWNMYRPQNVKADLFPSSCCFQYSPGQPRPTKLCDKNFNGLYPRGCLESIKAEEAFYHTAHLFFVFCLAIVSALTFSMSVAV